MTLQPVPTEISGQVNDYIRQHRQSARDYTNTTFDLDDSAVYDLHRLAGAIYARGWTDGHRVADVERRSEIGEQP